VSGRRSEPQSGYVYRSLNRFSYAEFLAASQVPFGLRSLALRLKLDYQRHPEHVVRVAEQLAEHGKLVLYYKRNGELSEVALPRGRLPFEEMPDL